MSLKLALKRIILLACGALILAIPVSLLYMWGEGSRPDAAKAELEAALAGTLPILVAMHSQNCPHCQADVPVLDELEEALAGELVIVRVDIGTEFGKGLAQELRLRGVPAYLVLDPVTQDLLYAQTGPLDVEQLLDALP